MKKCLPLLLLLIAGLGVISRAQDIPLFSQKLTNSFIYNPSLAGHTFGSMTASYRLNYLGVQNAPRNTFLSFHAPFANYRFGGGFNVFQENVGIWQNTYLSGAFAYHLHFTRFSILSFGVGAENNSVRLNTLTSFEKISLNDDLTLQRYNTTNTKPDFSFGMMYQNRFIKVGASANRLATAWLDTKDAQILSNYYSAFAQGTIPMRGGSDLLEPYIAFRKFSEINDTYDVGLYYTLNNKITFGGATRRGSVVNATLAYRLSKYLLVGYSSEVILGQSFGGFNGSSHEFTMRYDFSDQGFQKKFNSDYKTAVSYRRKSLNGASIKKTPGGRSPKQLNKAQKRVAAYSPNSRYQNMKKLSGGKKSVAKKPKGKSSLSKRKPPKKYKKKSRPSSIKKKVRTISH